MVGFEPTGVLTLTGFPPTVLKTVAIDLIKGEKLVAWALVAFAFLFVTNAIFAGIIYSNVYDSVYHGYATSKHEAARKDEFESRCSQITAVEELRSCFERHIETGWETQRAQEDLNAQKEMADWAFLMLIVTGLVGVATIVITATPIVTGKHVT